MAESAHPLVSIVTPVLDGVRLLEETLASVRGQDYPNIEHIVVDGGSTDGTLDRLRKAEGNRWISEPDRGLYDPVNEGFRMARGGILGQNSDDRYSSGAAGAAGPGGVGNGCGVKGEAG